MSRDNDGRVFIVDDDEDIRELFCTYLSGFGYSISQAADAASLRAIIRGMAETVLSVSLPRIH